MASGDCKADPKYNVIFVLGGPGAGKGTQCEKITQTFKYKHLSAGDLLRAEKNRPDESENKKLIQHYIQEGLIVPVKITCALIRQAMKTERDGGGCNSFLIDGFPRNKDNLDGWIEEMGDCTNLQRVLFFDCDEDTCCRRILKRGETSGRSDDNAEALKKRFNTYRDSTMPIINLFSYMDKVETVDATKEVDQVFSGVSAHLLTLGAEKMAI